MTWIAVTAIMENKQAAHRLYEHVQSANVAEQVGIADGTRVTAQARPETAEMTAKAFADFLYDR